MADKNRTDPTPDPIEPAAPEEPQDPQHTVVEPAPVPEGDGPHPQDPRLPQDDPIIPGRPLPTLTTLT